MNDLEHLREPCRKLAELMPDEFRVMDVSGGLRLERMWTSGEPGEVRRVLEFNSSAYSWWGFFGPLLAEFEIRSYDLVKECVCGVDEWRNGDPLTAVVLAVVDAAERKVEDETKTD